MFAAGPTNAELVSRHVAVDAMIVNAVGQRCPCRRAGADLDVGHAMVALDVLTTDDGRGWIRARQKTLAAAG